MKLRPTKMEPRSDEAPPTDLAEADPSAHPDANALDDVDRASSTHAGALMARFVIFASYGNDSLALIQWAHEAGLTDVVVVFNDTGWAADGWMQRVERCEAWVGSLGFQACRTSSIGFMELARRKQSFPTHRYQWCSRALKIEPAMRWLHENDPLSCAVCLIGVRREESRHRSTLPAYLLNSPNHGGRTMVAPLIDHTREDRDTLIMRAGFEVLPHRSRECRCINANRADMRRYSEGDWKVLRDAEAEIGQFIYRPSNHMGARGVDEVRRWAECDRGQFVPAHPPAVDPIDDLPDEDITGCKPGWCEP